MTGEMKDFEAWAKLARTEAAPEPDVERAVMRGLSLEEEPDPAAAGLWTFAAAAAAAACAFAVTGYGLLESMLGEWYGWFGEFTSWGML